MAYRHYTRRGFGADVMTTTTDGQLTTSDGSDPASPTPVPLPVPVPASPGPTDLIPVPVDLTKVDPASMAPMVPSTALTPVPATTTGSKLISADGVLGIPWKWIIIGGVLVAVAKMGGAAGAIVANFGRKKRRRTKRNSRRRH